MNKKITLLAGFLFFFAMLASNVQAQVVYSHDFTGIATTYTNPYTTPPQVLHPDLSNSLWATSVTNWANLNNVLAISYPASGAAPTCTLTFDVATGKQLQINSFDFWRVRSNNGPQNWSMTINGIAVGNGTTPTTGAQIGTTPVANPVTGLTGTVTIVITLTNGVGGGTFRLDNFVLNGTVTTTCQAPVVTSISPSTGPVGTTVTLNGSGFSAGTTAVAFNGTTATFNVVSDTQITAVVPAGATTGNITLTTNSCPGTGPVFSVLSTNCTVTVSGTEIYISEVYDEEALSGGAIELYNPTANTITFNGNYVIQRYANISDTTPTAGYIIALTGSIGPGMTYLIAGTNPANCTISAPVTFPAGFNGNDKFELLKNGVVIDVVNVPYTDPGYSLIRQPNAVAPSAIYNSADWDNSPAEDCSTIGSHTAVPTVPAPVITTQPQSQSVCVNGTTTLAIAVSNAAGYNYQWKVLNAAGNWVNVTNGGNYSGATTSTLTISNTPQAFNGNQYYVEISLAACTLVSNAVAVNVLPTPAPPAFTVTQPTCAIQTGTITINNPLPGHTYSINGTVGTTFSGVFSGTYTIIVQNSNGCSAQAAATVNPAPANPLPPTFTVIQPTCSTATGTITISNPIAGSTYTINGITGTTLSGLVTGDYTVTVQNTDGCTAQETATINAAPNTPAVPAFTLTQPTCTIPTGTVTISNPVAGVTYSINGTTGTTFSNLAPGTYTIIAENAQGCTSTTTANINATPNTPAVPVFTVTQPTCTTPTGTVTISNPVAGITYSINGTTGTTFSNLAPGTYTIIAENAQGCTATTTATINAVPNAPAVPTFTVTQPTCTTPTGTIIISNPVAGITYSINGTIGTTFSNLAPGTYTIIAENAQGCTSTTTANINAAPNAPAVPVFTVTQPTCTTVTGTITISNPVAGVTYSINGTTGTTFSTLAPGTYTVIAENAQGCTSTTTANINAAPNTPAVPVFTITQPTCTTSTGTITISNPVAGITYSINGTTGTTLSNLAPGTYTVIAENAQGCTSTTTANINAAPNTPAVPTLIVTQPTCAAPIGTITINNPVVGVTYIIHGIAGTTLSNLGQGTYTVTAENAQGCTTTTTAAINAVPSGPAIPVLTVTQPTCAIPTGTITISNPVAGLTYSINGITGTTFSNLSAGVYNVIVENSEGCTSSTDNITINVALPPQITTIQGCEESIFGQQYILTVLSSNNDFDVNEANFEWTINNNIVGNSQNTFNVTEYTELNNIPVTAFPLTVNVKVTTDTGCVIFTSFVVESTFCTIPKGVSPNNDTKNDTFNLIGLNVRKLSIFNRYGKEVFTKTNYRDEWHGQTDSGSELPTGTYYYVIEVTTGATKSGWVYLNREQ